MKRSIILLPAIALAVSCGRNSGDVIYEMNVCRSGAETTLSTAEQDLPRIKELGADVVLLGSCDSTMSVSEFCTTHDYESFAAAAGKLGLKVIADISEAETSGTYPEDIAAFLSDFARTSGYAGQESAALLETVLDFTLPEGRPVITAGREDFCRSLARLRHGHGSIRSGEYSVLDDQWVPDDVIAFTMTDRREQILVIANFCGSYHTCALPDNVAWKDAFTGEVYSDELVCPVVDPWGYRVLIRK